MSSLRKKLISLVDKLEDIIEEIPVEEPKKRPIADVKRCLSPFARTIPMRDYADYMGYVTVELYSANQYGDVETLLAKSKLTHLYLDGETMRSREAVALRNRTSGVASAIIVRSGKNPEFWYQGTVSGTSWPPYCDVWMSSAKISRGDNTILSSFSLGGFL